MSTSNASNLAGQNRARHRDSCCKVYGEQRAFPTHPPSKGALTSAKLRALLVQNLLTSTKVQILTREAPKVSRDRIEEISPSVNWDIFFEVLILLYLLVQKYKF